MAVSAAALAEPPADAAVAGQDEGDSSDSAVARINAPEELKEELGRHGSDLVVLMCKAHSCRPCKMFTRKFHRLAESYPDATFLEVYGDDTKELRKLMISMEIRVTPNFRLYRDGKLVHQLSGINETNLRNALEEH
jgi:thioredoxin 1